jgi:hypothetical protein
MLNNYFIVIYPIIRPIEKLCINPSSTTGEVKILTPNPNQQASHPSSFN